MAAGPGVVEGGPDQLGAQPVAAVVGDDLGVGEGGHVAVEAVVGHADHGAVLDQLVAGGLGVVAHAAGHAGRPPSPKVASSSSARRLGARWYHESVSSSVSSSTSTASKRTSTIGWPS